jgi:hypothetical protein
MLFFWDTCAVVGIKNTVCGHEYRYKVAVLTANDCMAGVSRGESDFKLVGGAKTSNSR